MLGYTYDISSFRIKACVSHYHIPSTNGLVGRLRYRLYEGGQSQANYSPYL